jgi:hypothetical protein
MARMLNGLNAALMFFLELGMLAGFAVYGLSGGKPSGARWLLGLGLPLVVVALWSYFAAPRSAHRLAPVPLVAFRLALFELAALAMQRSLSGKLGMCFAIVALLNQALALIWKQ